MLSKSFARPMVSAIRTRATCRVWLWLTWWIVIKLKQVEHVRNERRTLAAVVGHPFIITLVASFSDEQSLYMVVCRFGPCPAPCVNGLTELSWNFVPGVRFSLTFDGLGASMRKHPGSMRQKSQ